jgi:DNA-binding MarR family transcriptional regulator
VINTPDLIAAAAVGAVVGGLVHWLWRQFRTRRRVPASPETFPPVGPGSQGATRADLDGEHLGPPSRRELPVSSGTGVGAGDRSLASGDSPAEGLGLARRVIAHLYGLGALGPNDLGQPGQTQEGMARALAVRQGSLARVLQRLLAAEALIVEHRHVSGRDRRLMVYALTPLGEAIARDIRQSQAIGLGALTRAVPSKIADPLDTSLGARGNRPRLSP